MLCEILGFIFLTEQKRSNPLLFRVSPREVADLLKNEDLESFLECRTWICFHPQLGWWQKPGSVGSVGFGSVTADSFGSRITHSGAGDLVVATYGDSFTQGIEVDDTQTYQRFLETKSSVMVQNYGVLGFGPDQALLYLGMNLQRGDRPSMVILGLISESPNRLMNSLRLFYTYPSIDTTLGFKPVLVRDREGMRFHNFLPENSLDASALESAIVQAGDVDAFNILRTEKSDFPYSLNLFRYISHQGFKRHYPWPGQSAEAVSRLRFLMAEYLKKSIEYNFIPVVMLLPLNDNELLSGGVPLPDISQEDENGVIVIDIAREFKRQYPDSESNKPEYSPYILKTHPSAQGNALIADMLLASLCRTPRILASAQLSPRLCTQESGVVGEPLEQVR